MDGWRRGKGLHSGTLLTFFFTDVPQRTNATGVTITDRSCLIMDEVDGMSAGDRGGVGALAALIRKTKVSASPWKNASGSDFYRFPLYVLPTTVALPK